MAFYIILLNTFGLTAFIVLWLSLTFVAIGLYKKGNDTKAAISLAKLTIIMQFLLLVWFVFLGIAWANSDTKNPIWPVLYITYFVGLFILIRKFYGDVIGAIFSISKENGTKSSVELARKSLEAVNLPNKKDASGRPNLKIFYIFYWVLNISITTGAVVNALVNDSETIPVVELMIMLVFLVILIQIVMLPLLWIVRKVIFSTLGK